MTDRISLQISARTHRGHRLGASRTSVAAEFSSAPSAGLQSLARLPVVAASTRCAALRGCSLAKKLAELTMLASLWKVCGMQQDMQRDLRSCLSYAALPMPFEL